jgi:ferrous iron transport protein B
MDARAQQAQQTFFKAAKNTPVFESVDTPEKIDRLFDFASRYKNTRMSASSQEQAHSIDERFTQENAAFFSILKPRTKEGRKLSRAYKKLRRARLTLRLEAKNEIINRSFLGGLGKWLEPVTQYAGFTWRVNVALLSALAAKENTVATLGALYQPDETGDTDSLTQDSALEDRMAQQEAGFTPLHALALMLFMALYPPCMAATMVVKVQSGSWKWMMFSLIYMTCLGAAVAFLIFSGGSLLGLTGLEAMAWFYGAAVAAVVITGLIKPRSAET